MDPTWPVGVLAVAFVIALTVAQTVVAVRDSRRDTAAPFRPGDVPDADAEAWAFTGAGRTGVLAQLPGARMVVTRDRIGIRTPTWGGMRSYVVDRRDVEQVVIVTGGTVPIGAGVGVIGPDGPSGLVVLGTNRRTAAAQLDRLGWPHVRRRGGLLRPFRP